MAAKPVPIVTRPYYEHHDCAVCGDDMACRKLGSKWVCDSCTEKVVEGKAFIPVSFQDAPPDPPSLVGKMVCITGKLSRKRTDIVQDIRSLGGVETSNVNAAAVLVLGDTGHHGVTTKLLVARNRGIPIIDEQQLDKLLAKAGVRALPDEYEAFSLDEFLERSVGGEAKQDEEANKRSLDTAIEECKTELRATQTAFDELDEVL